MYIENSLGAKTLDNKDPNERNSVASPSRHQNVQIIRRNTREVFADKQRAQGDPHPATTSEDLWYGENQINDINNHLMDVEAHAAGIWLDVHKDQGFIDFCRKEACDPDTLFAAPDGRAYVYENPREGGKTARLRKVMSDEDHLDVTAGGSGETLLKFAKVLGRDIDRSIITSAAANYRTVSEIIRDSGIYGLVDDERVQVLSFFRVASNYFQRAYEDGLRVGMGVTFEGGEPHYDFDEHKFSRNFLNNDPFKSLAARSAGVAPHEISAGAALNVVAKMAIDFKKLYAPQVLFPVVDSPAAKKNFVEAMRSVSFRVGQEYGGQVNKYLTPADVDFISNILYTYYQGYKKLSGVPGFYDVHQMLTPPVHDTRVPDTGAPDNPSPGTANTDLGSKPPPTVDEIDTSEDELPFDAEVHVVETPVDHIPDAAAGLGIFGAASVFASSSALPLTQLQRSRLGLLGNAAALAGGALLAVIAPGAAGSVGAVGSSAVVAAGGVMGANGLTFGAIVNHLVEVDGLDRAWVRNAAVVQLGAVHLLVGLGAYQNIDLIKKFANDPSWKNGLALAGNDIATIGVEATAGPSFLALAPEEYGYLGPVVDMVSHGGDGAVVLGMGTMYAAEKLPESNEQWKRDAEAEWRHRILMSTVGVPGG